MTPREELVKEIGKLKYVGGHPMNLLETDCKVLADFILADRKRIVEPLVKYVSKYKRLYPEEEHDIDPLNVMMKVLCLAGAEE